MTACKLLCVWPDNILKILEVVFPIVALILYCEYFGCFYRGGDSYEALLIVPVICAIIVLIWYIIEDPGRYKLVLLIYYIVSAVLTGVYAVLRLIQLIKYGDYYTGSGIIILIVVIVLAILACVCYVVSAILNGMKGRP